MTKLIYIAGKLNGDACEYIQNINRMVQFAEEIRKLKYAVAIPCNDFIHGLVCGTHEYRDYFDNNLEIMKRCDLLGLVPGWKTSKGSRREIIEAHAINIPVFYTIAFIPNWEKKKWVREEVLEARMLGIPVLYTIEEIHKFIGE